MLRHRVVIVVALQSVLTSFKRPGPNRMLLVILFLLRITGFLLYFWLLSSLVEVCFPNKQGFHLTHTHRFDVFLGFSTVLFCVLFQLCKPTDDRAHPGIQRQTCACICPQYKWGIMEILVFAGEFVICRSSHFGRFNLFDK